MDLEEMLRAKTGKKKKSRKGTEYILPVGGNIQPWQSVASWHHGHRGDWSRIKFPVGIEGEAKGCNKGHFESLKMLHVSSN